MQSSLISNSRQDREVSAQRQLSRFGLSTAQVAVLALVALLALAGLGVDAQKTVLAHKLGGAPETLIDGGERFAAIPADGPHYPDSNDALNKVESQLFGALELLEAYREVVSAAPMPLKFAEKRRNKFEFIRFGRR